MKSGLAMVELFFDLGVYLGILIVAMPTFKTRFLKII